jgi:hypothetical protein
MKPALSATVLIILLASCIKGINNLPIAPKKPVPAQPVVIQMDTVPDGGAFKVMIQKDSAQLDETMVMFDHTASTMYFNSQDAVYFPGFGAASLCSLTSDNITCAIQKLPYLHEYPIGFKVGAKSDGIYILRLTYANQVPKSIRFWLKDKYVKDSLDLRVGNYAFNVVKADTNTYGSGRFTVVLR